MNLKKVVITNCIIALILSLLGFLIDSDPRVQSIPTNIFEIVMMALILFSAISIVFFGAHFILKSLQKFL